MAVTQSSIRVIKEFSYRGDDAKQFSNRYYFDGDSPGDSTTWHSLMDAIVLLEQSIFGGGVTIIECHGYDPGSDVAVASKAYTTAGVGFTSAHQTPGDCAAVCRWATNKKSRKNHTVYLMSYYHSALVKADGTDPDLLLAAQNSAIDAYAADWVTGISVGGRSYKRTTPDGHLVTGHLVDQWVGHRDFPN